MDTKDTKDMTEAELWDEVTAHPPDGPSMVGLFSEGDENMYVFWEKPLNRMVCIPKNVTTRVDRLGDYIELCFSADVSDVLGFQLIAFSRFAPHIWEILGRGTTERVALGEILYFYEGAVCGGSYAKATKREIDFLRERLEELRDLFGHITILQPKHARTIAL